jgi:acetylornithine deacetylase/succinyl-diaminopimelate desuccinylase-like protein
MSDVATLSASPRNSNENELQHATASEWIANQFINVVLAVERTAFDIPMQSPERSGLNIIGTLNPDSPDQPILIGAHYDTVPGSPGADDNASGVAAMLECARILVEVGSSRKVVLAAFDAEELQSPAEGLHEPHTLPNCEMRIAHQRRSFSKLSVSARQKSNRACPARFDSFFAVCTRLSDVKTSKRIRY